MMASCCADREPDRRPTEGRGAFAELLAEVSVFGTLGAAEDAEDAEAGVVGVAVGQGFDISGELVTASGEGSDVVGAVGRAGVEDPSEAVFLVDEVLDRPGGEGSPVSMASCLAVLREA